VHKNPMTAIRTWVEDSSDRLLNSSCGMLDRLTCIKPRRNWSDGRHSVLR
jgi:hypothetical protein